MGGSEYEKGLGWDLFFRYFFYRVFDLPSSRETPKNVITKNREKIGFGFLVEFFVKTFLCSAFELPSLRNTRKRDKTKKVEEKLTSNFLSIFWGKFSTWSFYKNMFVVFSRGAVKKNDESDVNLPQR